MRTDLPSAQSRAGSHLREPPIRREVGRFWYRWTGSKYDNFKCPVCGSFVKYQRVRGNLSPQLECSNDRCKWTVEDLASTPKEQKTKPKAISKRQWDQSSIDSLSN